LTEEHIDQRDIQKKGNLFAKYPASYIILKILTKYNINYVLDVTYGRGRFYRLYRPKLLIGIDPIRWEWIVRPDEFYKMTVFHFFRSLRNGEVIIDKDLDCVVIDPPKWNMVSYNKRDEYNFIIGTPKDIIEYGRKVNELVKAPYILLHFNQQLPIGEPIHIVKFRWLARYAHTEDKNLSYYILYSTS